jgi:hypothetical protein
MGRRRSVRFALGGAALVIGVGVAWQVIAASHDDGPTVKADPSSQITDVYAWMTSDKTKVNLVMNVYPNAPGTGKFSDQVLYVFHLNSSSGYAMTAMETKVVCGFDAAQAITCWVGAGEMVTGNAGTAAGIVSASGKTRVFAGLRDDPSFFNQTGFLTMATTLTPVLPSLSPDAAGCPTVSMSISGALISQLRSDGSNGPAVNNFAGQNVLSIVIQVDTALVTPGGKILGVWASTHHRG